MINILNGILVLIAFISIVVAIVNIMNTMYTSILERTREIGLRKAIGARGGLIKAQFLTESILITMAGGFIGIALGTLITLAIDLIAKLQGFEFGLSITLEAILVSLGSAILFGIVFGLYPARKASGLKPVDALRYE